MRAGLAFFRKEWTEQARSGRLIILGALFVLFGVMNPAIAKFTPLLLESMADSLAASGMTISNVAITALDSWTQFYKNMPMALIAVILLESGMFAREYASGTLVLALTKGLKRVSAVAAKAMTLMAVWTAGYWLCFGITYGYNAYFWDNAVARNIGFAALCWWLFGLLIAALTVMLMVVGRSGTVALGGDLAAVAAMYAAGFLPGADKYLPLRLMEGTKLLLGAIQPADCAAALGVTAAAIPACLAASVAIFNRKQL